MSRRRRRTADQNRPQQQLPAVRLLTKASVSSSSSTATVAAAAAAANLNFTQHPALAASGSTAGLPANSPVLLATRKPTSTFTAANAIITPTSTTVSDTISTDPQQIMQDFFNRVAPEMPCVMSLLNSAWEVNPTVAEYLTSDPSTDYAVIGLFTAKEDRTCSDILAYFYPEQIERNISGAGFTIWITRDRMIIVECVYDHHSIMQSLATLMAICNVVLIAIDCVDRDNHRIMRALRSIERFRLRLPELFPTQKDGQTIMADLVFVATDVPEDKMNGHNIERFQRRLLDNFKKIGLGQYQCLSGLSKISDYAPYISTNDLAIHLVPAAKGNDCVYRNESLQSLSRFVSSFIRRDMQRLKPTEESWLAALERVVIGVRKSEFLVETGKTLRGGSG